MSNRSNQNLKLNVWGQKTLRRNSYGSLKNSQEMIPWIEQASKGKPTLKSKKPHLILDERTKDQIIHVTEILGEKEEKEFILTVTGPLNLEKEKVLAAPLPESEKYMLFKIYFKKFVNNADYSPGIRPITILEKKHFSGSKKTLNELIDLNRRLERFKFNHNLDLVANFKMIYNSDADETNFKALVLEKGKFRKMKFKWLI